jgi:hypothetical protein
MVNGRVAEGHDASPTLGRYFRCSSVYMDSSIMRSRSSALPKPGKLASTSSFENRRQM